MVRLDPSEVVISPATEEDVQSIAEGYYASFGPEWHDLIEPTEGRPSLEVRVKNFAERLKPQLTDPGLKWSKATLARDSSKPPRVIGLAGWLMPQFDGVHTYHHWRYNALEARGYKKKMGWTDEQVKEIWSNVDVPKWEALFVEMDDERERIMDHAPHWFLAPLWVIPEYQRRGIASLLLKEVIDIADAQDPPTAIYLESATKAKTFYPKLGFEFAKPVPDSKEPIPLEELPKEMVRRGAKTAEKIV